MSEYPLKVRAWTWWRTSPISMILLAALFAYLGYGSHGNVLDVVCFVLSSLAFGRRADKRWLKRPPPRTPPPSWSPTRARLHPPRPDTSELTEARKGLLMQQSQVANPQAADIQAFLGLADPAPSTSQTTTPTPPAASAGASIQPTTPIGGES